jgi:hypothetical protein
VGGKGKEGGGERVGRRRRRVRGVQEIEKMIRQRFLLMIHKRYTMHCNNTKERYRNRNVEKRKRRRKEKRREEREFDLQTFLDGRRSAAQQ